MVRGRQRQHGDADGGCDGRRLRHAGPDDDIDVLGARVECGRLGGFVGRHDYGLEYAVSGCARHYVAAGEPVRDVRPERDAHRGRDRHRSFRTSVVHRRDRRHVGADRRGDVVVVHDAVAHGDHPLLGSDLEQRRQRRLGNRHRDGHVAAAVTSASAFSSATSVTAAVTATTTSPPPPPSGSSALEDQVLVLVNQRRASGATCGGAFHPAVAPLTLDVHLRDAARGHSSDMAARNYVSHTSLTGKTFDQRIWESGYTGGFPLGENVAGGQPSAEAVMNSLMASTGHCQAIMNGSYHVIGIGYAFNPLSTYGHYWTQDFGGG